MLIIYVHKNFRFTGQFYNYKKFITGMSYTWSLLVVSLIHLLRDIINA